MSDACALKVERERALAAARAFRAIKVVAPRALLSSNGLPTLSLPFRALAIVEAVAAKRGV